MSSLSRTKGSRANFVGQITDAADETGQRPVGHGAKRDGRTLVITIEGRTARWNFSAYSRPELALEVMGVFERWIEEGRSFQSFRTFESYRLKTGGFLTKIDYWDPAGKVQSLKDIDRGFLDILDVPNQTKSQHERLQKLIVLLREARRQSTRNVAADLLNTDVGDRLAFVSRWPKPISTPKDAYSPFVVKQIQDAARSEIRSSLAELREGIAGLKAAQQAAPTQEVTPIGAALLDLAAGGSYDVVNKAYKQRLRDAGANLEARRAPVEFGSFASTALHQAARSLARNGPGTGHGISSHDLAILKNYSPEFVQMVADERTIFLKEVRDQIRSSREAEDTLFKKSTPADATFSETSLLGNDDKQLARRLHVLEAWYHFGIPRSKMSSVKFDLIAISRWNDSDYGIKPIEHLLRGVRGTRSVYRERAASIQLLLHKLAQRYQRRPERRHYERLRWKVELLEDWVLGECPATLASTTLNREFLLHWEDHDLGLEKLNAVRTVPSHPRYGPLVEWAYTLLGALEVQLEARELRPLMTVKESRHPTLSEIAVTICPRQDELTSFLAHLALMCQIDLGSLKNLRRDCLENASDGFADIVYEKKRDNRRRRSERVRDGSLETPGGLIRVILELTEPAHLALSKAGHPDADYLWLGSFERLGFRKCRFEHPVHHPWWRFCERNVIFDNNGEQLDAIHPARFRKTVKATKYRRSGGDVFAIADDHTYAVARDHYADLPSLADVHDDTMTRGLQSALQDITSRIISCENPGTAEAERLSIETGMPVAKCLDVVEGREDVWLSACMAFDQSPFSAEGEDCATPYTECLHCPNSVFTSKKLPNLLRYSTILRERRLFVDDDTWRSKYLPDIFRIENQILPRFTEDQVSRAWGLVSGECDGDPLLLPDLVRMSL